MNKDRLKAQLSVDEKRSSKIYTDTVGKVSGGIGRNLTDNGFSDSEIDLMYANDIARAEKDARSLMPSFDQLDDIRQEVLVNMSFNMGYQRLAGFRNFLAELKASNFSAAADEMVNSKWYGQVGARGIRLANAMRTGAF